ncbi:MAG: M20 family metallopeptidase [Tissierellia bacterium]|nr:M20 family metallopeptidase [Tissierellia bacterium]
MKALKEKIGQLEERIREDIRTLSDEIYAHPELGFEEDFAATRHVALLEKYGFSVERPFLGFDTAFKAVYDSKKPGPVVALMAEYDALPGIGHGCGHNMLGASSTGAGIVLRFLAQEVGGQVVVLGTPAEETSGVKVDMAQAGVFKEMDVALIAHPDTRYRLSSSSLALQPIQFEFFGKASHAASEPHEGINALDGAILTFNNINALREHILPTARIHGVITHGGEAANIVPEYACAQFYVRAQDKKYLLELVEKVRNCAKAGALATGCRMEESEYEKPYDDLVTNQVLNQAYYEAIRLYTDEFVEEEEGGGGSLDTGNVSHCLPTIHGYFPIARDYIPAHSREFAQATQGAYAYDKLGEIISVLALVGYRVLTEEDLLKAAKAEYEDQKAKGKVIPPYAS